MTCFNVGTVGSRCAVSVSVALLATMLASTAPAKADDKARVDALESQMQEMNAKLDALMKVVAGSTESGKPVVGASAQPDKPQTAAAPPPSDFEPGLFMDLYTVEYGLDKWPEKPVGLPAASASVKGGASFMYDAYQKLSETSKYVSSVDDLGENWTGALSINESGTHYFQIELSSESNGRTNGCVASLTVSGKNIATAVIRGSYDVQSKTDQGTLDLAQGLHDFSIWLYCNNNHPSRRQYNKNIKVELLLKAPSDRVAKPISADRFFRKP